MSDERSGLPSASSAGRYAICPGSFLLEQQVPEEKSGADAEIGNRIHAALAGEKVHLSHDEHNIADWAAYQEQELVKAILGTGKMRVVREKRIWAFRTTPEGELERAWSGKPDVVYITGSKALVIDYKTGRGEVTKAVGNQQLRALAVLVHEQFGVAEVAVAIIQPAISSTPDVCHYSTDDLALASQEVQALMDSVRRPGQARVPSVSGCKYCRAKSICPEALAVVQTLPAVVPRAGIEIDMSPEKIGEFLAVAPIAEAVIEAVRGKARRLIESGATVPGWKLKPGTVRESITKPEVVFGRFLQAGGTQEQFMPVVTVAKGKLKDALKTATGAKGKDLEAHLYALLEGCTESKTTAPSLVAEKEVA